MCAGQCTTKVYSGVVYMYSGHAVFVNTQSVCVQHYLGHNTGWPGPLKLKYLHYELFTVQWVNTENYPQISSDNRCETTAVLISGAFLSINKKLCLLNSLCEVLAIWHKSELRKLIKSRILLLEQQKVPGGEILISAGLCPIT